MKTWVEILGRRVRYKFETPDDVTPVFGPPITVVDVTNVVPQPEVDCTYNSRTGVFTPAGRPVPPTDRNKLDADVSSRTTGALTAEETGDVLRLLLRRVFGV